MKEVVAVLAVSVALHDVAHREKWPMLLPFVNTRVRLEIEALEDQTARADVGVKLYSFFNNLAWSWSHSDASNFIIVAFLASVALWIMVTVFQRTSEQRAENLQREQEAFPGHTLVDVDAGTSSVVQNRQTEEHADYADEASVQEVMVEIMHFDGPDATSTAYYTGKCKRNGDRYTYTIINGMNAEETISCDVDSTRMTTYSEYTCDVDCDLLQSVRGQSYEQEKVESSDDQQICHSAFSVVPARQVVGPVSEHVAVLLAQEFDMNSMVPLWRLIVGSDQRFSSIAKCLSGYDDSMFESTLEYMKQVQIPPAWNKLLAMKTTSPRANQNNFQALGCYPETVPVDQNMLSRGLVTDPSEYMGLCDMCVDGCPSGNVGGEAVVNRETLLTSEHAEHSASGQGDSTAAAGQEYSHREIAEHADYDDDETSVEEVMVEVMHFDGPDATRTENYTGRCKSNRDRYDFGDIYTIIHGKNPYETISCDVDFTGMTSDSVHVDYDCMDVESNQHVL